MTLLNLGLLALIQGVTEFLPISSSAHLILFPALTGQQDQGLIIDLAVHVGTLLAVMLFFRVETGMLVRGGFGLLRGETRTADARLTLLIAGATVPVVLFGAAVGLTGLSDALRSVELIAWTTLIFAVLLWLADRFGPAQRVTADWGPRDALLMGLAQAVAIIPGVSRSGVTMTAARALGFSRVEGARVSLLMAIPATAAAGAYGAAKLLRSGDWALGADAGLAALLAFASAYAALVVLMRMLRSVSFTPFVVYRLALGVALLWVAYG